MPESRPRSWHAILHAHRYLILLGCTLAVILLRPVVATDYVRGLALDFLSGGIVLAYLGISQQWRSLAVCAVLVAAAVWSAWALYAEWDVVSPDFRQIFGSCSLALTILLLCYLSLLVLQDIFSDPARSWDNVYGALFVYFLAGVIFGSIYLAIYLANPGSFDLKRADSGPADPGTLMTQSSDFVYYSFVTISTLGYGDIAPLTPLTRTLSWMEAVLGQFFLAVFVARLIAAQAPHRHGQGPHG